MSPETALRLPVPAPSDAHSPSDPSPAATAAVPSDATATAPKATAAEATAAEATATTPGATVSDAHAAWSRVLDEIATMSAQAGPDATDEVVELLTAWNPPTGLGRLPADLADRALEVLAGHAHVVELLQAAVGVNRRHARVLSAVPTDAPTAAYLDVEA